jgi:hypothetical protein
VDGGTHGLRRRRSGVELVILGMGLVLVLQGFQILSVFILFQFFLV